MHTGSQRSQITVPEEWAGRADDSELKEAEFRDSIGSDIPQIIALLSDGSPLVCKAAADSVAQLSERVLLMSMESSQLMFDGLFGLPFRQIIALLTNMDEEVRHARSRSVADFFDSIRGAVPQIVDLLRTVIKALPTSEPSTASTPSSDHGGHIVNFWNHKDFQDRVLGLWGELARHYKPHNHLAGYKLLNEPTHAKHTHAIAFYDAVHTAIYSVDPDYAFFDGNTFGYDFSRFCDARKKRDTATYSVHDYSSFGFPGGQETASAGPSGYTKTSASRAWSTSAPQRLHDPLRCLPRQETPPRNRRMRPPVPLSHPNLRPPRRTHPMQGSGTFPNLYPHRVWTLLGHVARLSRNILVAEFLVKEWAEPFVGLEEDGLDGLSGSFRFAGCVKKEELNRILTENA
ncbi:hypothetical protein GALMADRAFT_148067 [Galerina marginata CBS 339.88]|uniref:Glycoside hydrolase family 5 domain-containing protein n=1 Tax=Galerina marginata (strain CBS 339.88) TaxID=685588 RepID=A0A067S5S6_GALM3|nr:hypothetical protein GALMADRAFT_148067 [Galerina marginata CBS 339.88]